MRSTRIALAVASGAVLTAVLTTPATAAPITPQCFQAQANVASQENNVLAARTARDNANLVLQDDENKLAVDQATVPVDPAAIGADQSKVAADQVKVNNAQASLRTAQANLDAAITTRDKVCAAPVPTPVPAPPTSATVPPPPPQVTIINPQPKTPDTVVINPPAPSGGSFTTTQVPSGAVATGDGSLANVG